MIRVPEQTILAPAVLADFECHHQNQAREAFRKLESILTVMVIPALGQQHPISKDLYAQLHNVKLGSQNFCWRYRYIGYRQRCCSRRRPMNNLQKAVILEGEVLSEAVLDARAMCSMNFARDEFNKLYDLLYPVCESHEEGPMRDIARHLEQIRVFSRNFCWVHRHLGASYGVVGERPGMEAIV